MTPEEEIDHECKQILKRIFTGTDTNVDVARYDELLAKRTRLTLAQAAVPPTESKERWS